MKKTLSLGVLLLLGSVLLISPDNRVSVAFNQKFIEGQKQELREISLNLENVDEVFDYVFSHLDSEVKVYPTENYYYFIFKDNGKEYWGNIRLAVGERDLGILNFVYWHQPEVHYKKYGASDGVIIKKINDFRYSVNRGGREVVFNLNQIGQEPPKIAKLEKDEVFVQKTFDESGFGFFLIFNKSEPSFKFILNEESKVPDRLILSDGGLLIGERSGFAFSNDVKNSRKILVGVKEENVSRNAYYDGPFDQLADNYIKGTELKGYIEAVYPGLKGKIDNYGHYLDDSEGRVAIAPYDILKK